MSPAARVVAAAVLLAAGSLPATAAPPITGRLTSAALGEVREYTVRLPDDYGRTRTRRYPVVYVLDGPPLDDHTAEAATALARGGKAPGVIVIGIPNMQRGGRPRDFLPPALRFARRDGTPFTGGADRFLRFLRDELVPRIEREYRTAAPRLLVGHSLGAIFVCYSLTAAPGFFDARFAHSPAIWRDEDVVIGSVERYLASARGIGGFFYVSAGTDEGETLQRGYHRLRAVLAARAAGAGLRWQGALTPGAVHETSVRLASPVALAAYFAGLAAPGRPR
jgi:predicted alpha/beta superfamily hydrolase